jgi:hypothetical protein
MGIDYGSKVIIGWEVDYEVILQYMLDHQVGSCDSGFYGKDAKTGKMKYWATQEEANAGVKDTTKKRPDRPWEDREQRQCLCDTCTNGKKACLPEGVYIVQAHPYFDCGQECSTYHISLTDGNSIPLSTLSSITPEAIQRAKEFARTLGCNIDRELYVSSVPHIW